MMLKISSLNSTNLYKNLTILNIYLKNESFSIMKNHYPIICNLKKIYFLHNGKKIHLSLYNAILIHKRKVIKIVCENYIEL